VRAIRALSGAAPSVVVLIAGLGLLLRRRLRRQSVRAGHCLVTRAATTASA
jgi:nitrate reductase gamma subunit